MLKVGRNKELRKRITDRVSEQAADISMLGIRPTPVVEETDKLIDQLPED